MNSTETLILTTDRLTAEGLVPVLEQQGAEHHLSTKRNIDGDTAAWIVVATLTGQALPHVLTFLEGVVGDSRVKRIKLGGWEVDNPTQRDVELFRALARKSLEGEDSVD